MFEKFPSLTRFSHDWIITEKIDGSNGQILIVHDEGRAAWGDQEHDMFILDHHNNHFIYAGSRKRLLQPDKDKDNMGFAGWVQRNAKELIECLGEGRHFGEWCGKGIQRGYDLDRKLFALFNTHRWADADLPEDVTTVPVLYSGYADDPGSVALTCMNTLKISGSVFSPGFMNPEGVVMRHGPSGTTFKKTYDYDEKGKWAEKLANKA